MQPKSTHTDSINIKVHTRHSIMTAMPQIFQKHQN